MSNVIRSLIVKVGADTSEFQSKMKNVGKDLKATGKSISSAGKTLTKNLTVPIVGAAAGISALAVKAGQGADELITMANKTGISTQKLQEFGYAARFIDVEVSTMADSIYKMTRRMDMARKGTGAQAEAFAKLGVSVSGADGDLRDANEVFLEAIDALGAIENETERDVVAYDLFGRSAQELNPLIKAGSDELRRLSKEAQEVGAVLSDETVTSLGKFDDEMQKAKAILAANTAQLGAAFVPALQAIQPILINTIIPAIVKFVEKISSIMKAFSELDPGTQKFILGAIAMTAALGPTLKVVGGLITSLGGAFTALSKFSGAMQTGKTVTAALGLALGPGAPVLIGLAALAAVAVVIYKNFDKIKSAVSGAVTKVKEFFKVDNGKTYDMTGLAGGNQSKYGTAFANAQANTYKAYAKGTNYVPETGLALLHKGEAVIPASQNKPGIVNHTGTITIKGVDDRNQLVAIVEKTISNNVLQNDRRLPNRASLMPL